MRFVLTRHGEKQKIDSPKYIDHFNVCLTEKGIEQITELGNFLKSKYPELVGQEFLYCSTMPRSIQSGEILRNIIGLKKLTTNGELREFFGTNNYALPSEERRRLGILALEHKDLVPKDVGRSLNQAIESFRTTLKSIADTNKNELVLIAGHGLINRYFIYTFAPELEPEAEVTFENGSKEGGYSIVEYVDGKFSLVEYNPLPEST